jgi:hypothetical protein
MYVKGCINDIRFIIQNYNSPNLIKNELNDRILSVCLQILGAMICISGVVITLSCLVGRIKREPIDFLMCFTLGMLMPFFKKPNLRWAYSPSLIEVIGWCGWMIGANMMALGSNYSRSHRDLI